MALPSIILPEYKIKLLTTDQCITIRPLTVREEKILLMALEGNTKDIIHGIRQIINNCVKDPINLDDLYFFELLYIFMHIKKISSGEEIKCKLYDTSDTNIEYIAVCDLNKDIIITGLDNLKEFDKPIKITDNDIYVEVKPIKFKDYIKLVNLFDVNDSDQMDKDKIKFIYTSMLLTIKKIYNNEESFDPSDYTMEELESFYESFPQKDKLELQKKYEYMPRLALRFHYKDKDGNDKFRDLEKVDFNFFG